MDFSLNNIWIYIIPLAAISIAVSYYLERKRSDAMKVFAKKHGYRFFEAGQNETFAEHQVFALFSKGRSKKLKNELYKRSGDKQISIFGYQYTQGSGKNARTYKQTIVSIVCDRLNAPKFALKPENTFHKIGQVFGYQDIDFESAPLFSKNYLLRGSDESAVREFFTPALITYFEANPNINIEACGNMFIFYVPAYRCSPQVLEDFCQQGQNVLKQLM